MFSKFVSCNDSPLYYQLAEYIKELIHNGDLEAGGKLPSIREISEQTLLSKNTVSSAISVLNGEGYIKSEEKKRAVVMWKPKAPSSPDWFKYINSSKHIPTESVYRSISLKRGRANIINAYEIRLGQDFEPGELIQNTLRKISGYLKDIYHQSYFDLKGIPWVRQAICSHLRRYGIYVDISQILMAQGPLNAMTMITQGILSYGMNVYLPVPNTLNHLKNFASSGFNVVNIPQDDKGIIPSALDEKIRNSRGILHLNTVSYWPNNATMDELRIKSVLDICVKNKTPIMESDMMREYGAEILHTQPMKASDFTENVIYICTFTRPLMPGLRVSAIVGPELVINRLADMRLQADWSMDSISQLIMGELISSGMFYDYIDKIRPMLSERLDETDKLLHKYLDGIAVWRKRPNGLSFWIEFDKSIDTSELNTLKDGVLISPGKIYGEEFKNCIWLCYSGVTLKEFEYTLSVISNAAFEKLKK